MSICLRRRSFITLLGGAAAIPQGNGGTLAVIRASRTVAAKEFTRFKSRFANDRFKLFALFFSAADRNWLLGFPNEIWIRPFLYLDRNCSSFSSCGAARSVLVCTFGVESLHRNSLVAAKLVSIDRLCDFSIFRDRIVESLASGIQQSSRF